LTAYDAGQTIAVEAEFRIYPTKKLRMDGANGLSPVDALGCRGACPWDET
jgi:hypothetical protein